MTEKQFNLLRPGYVVQISPEGDGMFAGCFLVVTEVKSWGVQGYVRIPDRGNAYYRADRENIEFVGESAWGMEFL